jgi:hypothetical protein
MIIFCLDLVQIKSLKLVVHLVHTNSTIDYPKNIQIASGHHSQDSTPQANQLQKCKQDTYQ